MSEQIAQEFDPSNKRNLVREMLLHMQRRGRLQELADTLRDKWPHVLS